MTVALEESVRDLEEKMEKTVGMRDKLMEGLLLIPGTILNGDPERRLPGNVNVSFDGIEGESLLTLLDAKGISASAGSACHTGVSEPSHVLRAIGRTREQALSALRLTIDENNTDEEIDIIIGTVRESVEYLRKFTSNRTK
jgi:cysteine desulfurase